MDVSQNRSRQEDAKPVLHVTIPAFFGLNASLKGALCLLFVLGFVLHYSQIMFAFLSLGELQMRG